MNSLIVYGQQIEAILRAGGPHRQSALFDAYRVLSPADVDVFVLALIGKLLIERARHRDCVGQVDREAIS